MSARRRTEAEWDGTSPHWGEDRPSMYEGMAHGQVMDLLLRADRELAPYLTLWDVVTHGDVVGLRRVLGRAKSERPIQRLLEQQPELLIQHLGGGHGRWVIPQQRLGAEYVPDFLIGERHSSGFDWYAVELESPTAKMFTKQGDPTRALTHAIRQIQDWRAWLEANKTYAERAQADHGLGLPHISNRLRGLILIGRRAALDLATNVRRRQMMYDLRIDIHTYDFLIEAVAGRAEILKKRPNLRQGTRQAQSRLIRRAHGSAPRG